MPDHGHCRREGPSFLTQMEEALDEVIRDHPQIFNLRDTRGCGSCYKILDVPTFEREVVLRLERKGLCAVAGEEFGIKNTNAWNDQYDLETSSFYIRRQLGSYQATCYPAAF